MRFAVRLCCIWVLLTAVAAVAAAANLEGILIDRHCSAQVLKGGQKAAQAHTRQCALMPDCIASGYGVVTADGKFVALDGEGNKKAEAALRASTKKADLRVVVTGEQTGDTIKVATLKLL